MARVGEFRIVMTRRWWFWLAFWPLAAAVQLRIVRSATAAGWLADRAMMIAFEPC